MLGFPIKTGRERGVVETLLVIPIFLLLAWGTVHIFRFLRQATEVEKRAWALSLFQSKGLSQSEAREEVSTASSSASLRFHICSMGLDGLDYWGAASNASHQLPTSFRGFLLLHPRKRMTLCGQGNFEEEVFQKLSTRGISSRTAPVPSGFRAAVRTQCEGNSGKDFSRKVEYEVPGHSFKEERWLTYALWGEAMHKAGFSYYFLPFLAVPELTRVVQAGVGIATFGGEGANLLSSEFQKRLQTDFSEVSRTVMEGWGHR